MAAEVAVLRAAAEAGVPVPRVVAVGEGTSFVVLEHVAGETIARKILRDDEYAGARQVLAGQCGRALAALHAMPVDTVPGLDAPDQVAQFRAVLDASGQPHPAFELGFRHLEATRSPPSAATVVHGDFRLGNLIVGPDGLRAVLDWELVHLGDPLEDLSWLCVKSWRFGAAPRVGGFGEVPDLVGAYEEASGRTVDLEALRWWETLGTLKWGIMCIMQAAAHLSGAARSVELAAIGRRVCEVEHDLLLLLP
jgi:aminoglycoside phosphotransferase (APT) family kinase protein